MNDSPNEAQKRALQAISELEKGKSSVLNRQDAEECCDKGWLEPSASSYRLTDKGRKFI